jgi:hypothetical protein
MVIWAPVSAANLLRLFSVVWLGRSKYFLGCRIAGLNLRLHYMYLEYRPYLNWDPALVLVPHPVHILQGTYIVSGKVLIVFGTTVLRLDVHVHVVQGPYWWQPGVEAEVRGTGTRQSCSPPNPYLRSESVGVSVSHSSPLFHPSSTLIRLHTFPLL